MSRERFAPRADVEGACECGATFAVDARGAVMHPAPPCDAFRRLDPVAYLRRQRLRAEAATLP